MALRYTGEAGVMWVNGRRIKPGDLITDPQEINDLARLPEFNEDKPKKAPKKASK